MKEFILYDYDINTLRELSKEYHYIVKANDKVMSNWGQSEGKKHIQLILCKSATEKEHIMNNLYEDKSFNYINWYPLSESYLPTIIGLKYKYSVSLRNDWKR